MQSGQTLNIETGGFVGIAWARVGRESAAYVNMSGDGTFVMNDDDLYLGLEGGKCVWTMSDTSSLYVEPSTSGGDKLYVGQDGGNGTLRLIGSNVTVNVNAIKFGVNTSSDCATIEYVLDSSGASRIVTFNSNLAINGQAHLVVTSDVTPPQSDIVLIETTSSNAIGGNGVFDTANSGSAAEGTNIDVNGNRYTLTYQYDANLDSANNDVALLYAGPTPCASEPSPQAGNIVEADEVLLSWRSAAGIIRNEIYLGTDLQAVANTSKLSGDVDGDGIVGLDDLSEMADQWLLGPTDPCPDLDWSGAVDLPDFALLGSDWLDSSDPIYAGTTTASEFDPGSLEPGLTYYWRVDSVYCDRIEQSPVWSFETKLPAFPGADGFGKWAKGGRGGSVYHVTNLNASGTGSFRDAVSSSNRTVVFDVGGIINISDRFSVSKNVTIAGQTAPGEGIMVYGNGMGYTNSDQSITRFMRYRMGVNGTSDKDAVGIADGKNMIFDHCSVSWGRDENFSINPDSGADLGLITIQDCIIGQGLLSHSCGGLIVDWDYGVSIIRTLYIDNNTRNPKVRGKNEFINNIVYNWDTAAYIMAWTDSLDYYSYVNAINNYFISGPQMDNTPPFRYGNAAFHIYHSNNVWDSDLDGVLDGRVLVDDDYTANNETIVSDPFDYPGVKNLYSPKKAVKYIASASGASLPVRDRTDIRLIGELNSYGTMGEHISNENASPMYGVGTIANGHNPTDTDQDGMPDYWEDITAGHNKYVADNNADYNGNGYTDLEDYINWMAIPHANVQKNAYAFIDLSAFSKGFDSSAVYTVSNSVKGTVTLLSDGHTARFVPDTDYVGVAEFDFNVNDGRQLDFNVQLVVSEYGGDPLDPVYPSDLTSGVMYDYYQGTWQYLPDFDSLTAYDTDRASNFDISSAPDSDSFGFDFNGYIEIPSDGLYSFFVNSDDGSRLYIDDGVVVSNDGVHSESEAQGSVALLAGKHKIRVTYFDNSGGNILEVRWAGPNFNPRAIPDSALFSGTLDLVNPKVPAGFWAAGSDGQVTLDWDDNSDSDLAGYNVYRTTTSGSGYVQLNSSLLTTSAYTDTDVTNSTVYHYIVVAVDTSMNQSDYPNEVSAEPGTSDNVIIQESTIGFCGVDSGSSIDNNNSGYTGVGFINTENAASEGADWSVVVPSTGSYTITWRYSNGGGSDRPGDLLVDSSTVVSNVSFPATTDWATWDTVTQTVSLTAGTRTIRIESTAANTSGLGNVDYIQISGAVCEPVDCD